MPRTGQKKSATPKSATKKKAVRATTKKTTSSKPISVAQLRKELQQREAELAIIKSVQDGLASKMEMQAIYELVGGKIRDLFKSQTTIIATFNRKAETQSFNYYVDRQGREQVDDRPMSGLVKALIREKKTFLFNENVEDRMREFNAALVLGPLVPKSALYVPLMTGGQVRGVISHQNKDKEHAFNKSDAR